MLSMMIRVLLLKRAQIVPRGDKAQMVESKTIYRRVKTRRQSKNMYLPRIVLNYLIAGLHKTVQEGIFQQSPCIPASIPSKRKSVYVY